MIHANSDLLLLYYDIGTVINEYKTWGNKFIDNLSYDIQIAFPERKGYSVRNLKYMAKFAARFSARKIVQEVLAQITWYHNIALMDKVTNFEHRLPSPQSKLAVQTMKAPYVFDFIPFREDMLERGIEQDNPSIVLLLCKSKNNVVAEYSLKDISKPIGVSEYKITSSLPDDLEKQLPSVEDIQKRIK